MNIFALPGFRVTLTEASTNNGSEADKVDVMKHLKLHETHTVKEVHTFSLNWTMVILNELPGLIFNADCLEDVEKQSADDNRKHPQWLSIISQR